MFTNASNLSGFIDCTGASKSASAKYSYDSDIGSTGAGQTSALSYKYSGYYFGSGTTPPQKSDYCLESVILSGTISVTSASTPFLSYSDGKSEFVVSWVITNVRDTNVTISEIGYFGRPNTSSTSSNGYLALYERTVLDNPITIKPGESKLVTYKITFNQTQ